ncbi:unnamed protein product [Dovyalis caffra]|uniref:Uncharacterized protein n=1 Tax=Dovyalis caffra TaxID=77055 RepID=A0AAV1SGK0_9ROSI|nr:unnamed protein product [Dovyalis caffra]
MPTPTRSRSVDQTAEKKNRLYMGRLKEGQKQERNGLRRRRKGLKKVKIASLKIDFSMKVIFHQMMEPEALRQGFGPNFAKGLNRPKSQARERNARNNKNDKPSLYA